MSVNASQRLKGRVAVVTGGAQGIGFGIAARLADEGAALRCSLEDIAPITGHETDQMAQKYIKKKRKAKLAIGKLDAATAAQKSDEVQNRA
jgi:NAD(P)-dependent dehydrogenase (short-subunit alcohol dehydrogenase family)